MWTHLGLRLRVFLFFAALALGATALMVAGLVLGYLRLGEDYALSSFVTAGFIGGLAIFALTTWVWTRFDEHVARPVETLAAEMRARAHAEVAHAIDEKTARYLGDLAPAAAAVARHLTETRNAMAQAVGRETAKLGRETARLAALLAEVPQGVVFCGPDHRIVLYNGQARAVLGDPAGFGLNRPLGDALMPGPLRQAYDRLYAAGAREGADILVATAPGARLIEARMRLLWLEGQETGKPGYVLSLTDVSRDLPVQAERARLLTEAIDAGRAAAAALPDHPAAQTLAGTLDAIEARKAPTDTRWWPMEALAASDLGAALAARLDRKGIALDHALPDTRLRCDGFAVTRLFERLALEWHGDGARRLVLTYEVQDDSARLALTADAAPPDAAVLARWLDAPLSPGLSHFAGRDVLLTHGTALDARLGLTLALADPAPARAAAVEYDFDLLEAEIPERLAEAPLRRLSFVVFDTETTGLNPMKDEICQIAAVRVVNGRVVPGERFDMLVDPGRPIPAAATEVHHLTDAMVSGAPSVREALARFHDYAAGAVLVAHNAPFDMAFLQRREGEIHRRFDQPILDTVLLSAILFGQAAEHTLDALCLRLGVTIPEEARHTAIGDALGTAEALAKMMPMLEAAGLSTLGATIAEFDRHARLIANLN